MELLLATKNKGKIQKFGAILNELGIKWCTLDYLSVDVNVVETGMTTRENALLKAKTYHEVSNMAVLCDDSGLYIDKLPIQKQPGVFVRRYGGKELTDEETINMFSEELGRIGGESTGRFIVSLAIIDKNSKIYSKDFISERYFISKPCKERVEGLPLRSLIYYKQYGKYMAQMTHEEANHCEGSVIEKEKEFIKRVLCK